MAETKMSVKLLAHTQLNVGFRDSVEDEFGWLPGDTGNVSDPTVTDGQAVALSAIRTCYSPGKPSEIVAKEGAKYFGKKATDGKGGTEADRLIRMIVSSKHTSTLEGITFNFAVEGVSRALLAQITRHRVGFSFSVQSQRYVKFGSGDRSEGFDYIVPESIAASDKFIEYEDEFGHVCTETPYEIFEQAMERIQGIYDLLRKEIPAEDCRAVLPNAAATNFVMTANLRSLLDFYSKRRKGRGAQSEICNLAEELRKAVTKVEPWTDAFFEQA